MKNLKLFKKRLNLKKKKKLKKMKKKDDGPNIKK